MAELQKRVSATAQRVAATEARQPKNMSMARENGRDALERLLEGTLNAAALRATVRVRFAGEGRSTDREEWDRTRSIEEVLGLAR
jgi:hypothetical protein